MDLKTSTFLVTGGASGLGEGRCERSTPAAPTS